MQRAAHVSSTRVGNQKSCLSVVKLPDCVTECNRRFKLAVSWYFLGREVSATMTSFVKEYARWRCHAIVPVTRPASHTARGRHVAACCFQYLTQVSGVTWGQSRLQPAYVAFVLCNATLVMVFCVLPVSRAGIRLGHSQTEPIPGTRMKTA